MDLEAVGPRIQKTHKNFDQKRDDDGLAMGNGMLREMLDCHFLLQGRGVAHRRTAMIGQYKHNAVHTTISLLGYFPSKHK